jgi:hypothetical protein
MNNGDIKRNGKTAQEAGLAVGYGVALTLREGTAPLRCYVGQVQAVDEHGVRITLIDWLTGAANEWDFFATWDSITSALVATPAHATELFADAAAKWQSQSTALGQIGEADRISPDEDKDDGVLEEGKDFDVHLLAGLLANELSRQAPPSKILEAAQAINEAGDFIMNVSVPEEKTRGLQYAQGRIVNIKFSDSDFARAWAEAKSRQQG